MSVANIQEKLTPKELSPEEQVAQILWELKSEILDTNQQEKINEIETLLQKEEAEKTDDVIQDSLLELNSIQREVNKTKIFSQIDEQIKFFEHIIETSKNKFTNSPEWRQTFRDLKRISRDEIENLDNAKKQLSVVNTKGWNIEQIFVSQQEQINKIQAYYIDSWYLTDISARASRWEKVNVLWFIDSQKDARREQNNTLDMAKYNKQIEKMIHDTTVLQLFNNDAAYLKKTMEAIRLWTIDRTDPVSLAQIEALYQLQQQGNLEQYPDIEPLVLNNQNIVNQMQNQEKNNIVNWSTKEAFEKWGLMWMLEKWLDQTKMTPKQKEFWKGTSGLLGTAGAVFVGWKMISSAWKLATSAEARWEKSNRAWLLGPAALTFGANAVTGGNITDLWKGGKLTEYIWDLFGGKENNNEDLTEWETKFNDTYSKWFLGVWALFSGLSMDKIKKLVQKDNNGKIEVSEEWYKQLEAAHKEKNDENSKAALSVLSNRKESDKLINLGLEGIFGDYETLEKEDDKKEFNELYAEKIARFAMISAFLENKKYEISSLDEFGEDIKNFINKWEPKLNEMEEKWAFLPEKFEINKNFDKRESFNKKIELTTIWEPFDIKIDKENVSINKINDDEIEVKTEWDNTTKINITKWTIVWLWYNDTKDYAFKKDDWKINYYDLLSTALLTTQIKNRFEDPQDGEYFEIKDWDIYFNEATVGDEVNEKKLFDDGIKWYFNTYPESLENQKEMIVNYLNKSLEVIEKPETIFDTQEKIETQKELMNDGDTIECLIEDKKIFLKKLDNDKFEVTSWNKDIISWNKEQTTMYVKWAIEWLKNENGNIYEGFKTESGEVDFYKLLTTTNTLNELKGVFKWKQYIWDKAFIVEDWDIYFNEDVSGVVSKKKVFDNGLFGFNWSYPDEFVGREQLLADFLNNNLTITNSLSMGLDDETKKNITNILNENMVWWRSFWGAISYDKNKREITLWNWFGIDETIVSDDQFIENLEKLFSSQSSWDKINDKEIVKTVKLNTIDLSTPMNVVYLEKLLKFKDKISFGPAFEWEREMIEYYLKNFDKIEEGKVSKENTAVTLADIESKYTEAMKTKYEKQLKIIQNNIENILNEWITSGKILFNPNSLEYDEVNKILKISGLNTKNIQNDKIVMENLENLLNQVSWYNVLENEKVEKIYLDNITLGPSDRISIDYLKKLLKLNDNIILWGDFVKHKEIIERVAKKFDEWNIKNKYNTSLNMNGIIMLNYIYKNDYDFDKIWDGEDDSRADFITKAMEKLESLNKSLDINKDPFQERDMTEKTNINYGMDYKTKLKVEKNNQDLLNMVK